MKKLGLLLLSALICISVSGCGKSDSVKAADNLIMAIGSVTLDSESAILSAEKAIAELTEKELKSLDNLELLTQARADYNAALVSHVEDMITNIESVTVNSKNAIETARNTYNQLSANLKPLVKNYSILTEAEEEYKLAKNELKRIEDGIAAIGTVDLQSKEKIAAARYRLDNAPESTQASVKNIDVLIEAERVYSTLCVENTRSLIEAIGTVTLDSKGIIESARTAFDDLSLKEQGLVENYSNLTAAEDTLAQMEDAEQENIYKAALNSLRTEVDKVEGVTWYISTQQPQYANTRSFLFPYIGQDGQDTWLRLKFNYTGDDWIFYESVTISVDGQRYHIDLDYSGIHHDNKYGDVWEVADISPSESDIEMLWDIANSEETVVRFQADHVHYDLIVRAKDKAGIKNVLIVYENMIADD